MTLAQKPIPKISCIPKIPVQTFLPDQSMKIEPLGMVLLKGKTEKIWIVSCVFWRGAKSGKEKVGGEIFRYSD
jgi:hypothetical protein